MRISPEQFQRLSDHVLSFLSKEGLSEDDVTEHYHARGLSLMRARWDTLHASKFPTATLYNAGLSDSHIDTALRKILSHPAP